MVSHITYNKAYGTASLRLTNAISELVESIDSPDFNKAFWKVQQASERWKEARAASEQGCQPSLGEEKMPVTLTDAA